MIHRTAIQRIYTKLGAPVPELSNDCTLSEFEHCLLILVRENIELRKRVESLEVKFGWLEYKTLGSQASNKTLAELQSEALREAIGGE